MQCVCLSQLCTSALLRACMVTTIRPHTRATIHSAFLWSLAGPGILSTLYGWDCGLVWLSVWRFFVITVQHVFNLIAKHPLYLQTLTVVLSYDNLY